MPIEIRELVIQAKVQDEEEDDSGKDVLAVDDLDEPGVADNEVDGKDEISKEDQIELIVERCVARLQEWLNEKSMR